MTKGLKGKANQPLRVALINLREDCLKLAVACDSDPDGFVSFKEAERIRVRAEMMLEQLEARALERTCRVCGCTEADCEQCLEKTGRPCSWVEIDLCSACVKPRKRGRK